jgi:hypothetical protein
MGFRTRDGKLAVECDCGNRGPEVEAYSGKPDQTVDAIDWEATYNWNEANRLPRSLKALREMAEQSEILLEQITLTGTMYLAYKHDKETISVAMAKEYVPAVTGDLELHVGDTIIGKITTSDYDHEDLISALEEVNTVQRCVHKIPYTYNCLFAKGDKVDPPQPFSAPFGLVLKAFDLEKEFISLIGRNKKDRLMENRFELFQLTSAYLKAPCSFAEFLSLHKERSDLDHVGLTFKDYYDWFRNSEKMLDGQGAINAETSTRVTSMLTRWGTERPADNSKYWLCRNLEVHPRHKALFHDFIDAFYAQNLGNAVDHHY